MLAFMWWILIGLVAGLIARLLVPGKQPMGWLMTMVLGLAGSLLGGFISSAVFHDDPAGTRFHSSGLIMSTIGALILLGAYVAYGNRRRRSIP
jgi:uncharacterized membrane protein YeaQ/YmgE (transglycosylase-associated protein family)